MIRFPLRFTLVSALFVAATITPSVAATHHAPVDPLSLKGKAATSVIAKISISNNGIEALTGVAHINLVHNQVLADLTIPLLVTQTALQVRWLNNKLYYTSTSLTPNHTWYVSSQKIGSLKVLSTYLAHPPLALILAAGGVAVHHATFTSYSATIKNGGLTGKSKLTSGISKYIVKFNVGSGGEITSLSVTEVSASSALSISAQIISYDRPVNVPVPAKAKPGQSLSGLLSQISGTSLLGGTSGVTTTTSRV